MLKPLQKEITIGDIRLEEKMGEKSDWKDHFDQPVQAALLIVDSEKNTGRRADRSAGLIRDFLQDYPVNFMSDEKLKAEPDIVRHRLEELIESDNCELVFLCGSTGPNPDDIANTCCRIEKAIVPGLYSEMPYQR